MFKFKDLMIEGSGLIVFGFGRFNPPTIGHEKVIEKIKSVAGSAPFRVYPSHSVGPKDPLPHPKKVAYMRKMFPKYKKNIIVDKTAKTAIHIAVKLYDEGYTDLVMVAGSDRVAEFEKLLTTYNGVEGKRHGYYKFNTIKIVSAGQRDPDSEGVEGMSASKMRAAAADSKFDDFKTGIPNTLNDADKKKLYLDVRKHMGIREERDMGELTDFESMRDAYLTGKVWNIDDVVEANGYRGKIVNRGTNYISFVDEDNKVHKTWLHDIDLDEVLRTHRPRAGGGREGKSIEQNLAVHYKLTQDYIKQGMDKDSANKKAFDDVIKMKPAEKKRILAKEEVQSIDERNYRKEYDNYHSRPEQIERRSSRNKARRAMGDKVKSGKDVGHKDNNPLNNDPKNLRNEVPSDNRREPRLREDIQERELTDTELKRREEIAKDLPDADFKKRYGARWKEVKMGVATNMAKKESLKT